MTSRFLTLCFLFTTTLAAASCTEVAGVRRPTFAYVKEQEGGCGYLFFYKGTKDRIEVLWASVNKKKLKLPDKGSKSFDLASSLDGLTVAVDLWKAPPRFSAYCNDIGPDTTREAIWKAKKGKVTITVFEPEDKQHSGRGNYRANLKLEGVVFEDDAGHQAILKEESITNVLVGWYAG
jgi:hypothetical protein